MPSAKDVPDLYVYLGERLKNERIRKGRTQERVGAAIGLTGGSVHQMEKAQQQLLVHHLVGICRYLGVDPGVLLSEVAAETEYLL